MSSKIFLKYYKKDLKKSNIIMKMNNILTLQGYPVLFLMIASCGS